MNRTKKLCILLGVLAVACAATLAVTRMEAHREQIKNSDTIILELPADTVQSLSWEYNDDALAFHRDGVWRYDGDESFPVDGEKLDGLLEQFRSFGASFIIEDVEDYGQYGLTNPVCTITLSTGEQTYEVELGNYSAMDAQRYVSIGDGRVYLVKHDPLDEFDVVLSDLIDHDELPSFNQVTRIQFAGAENYTITCQEDSADSYSIDDIYFTRRGGGNLPLDTARVTSYLRNITSLDPVSYVSYNVTREELQEYGLDEPELTVTVDYTVQGEDGEETAQTFVLYVSPDPEDVKAAREAEDGGQSTEVSAYIRVGDSQIVYQISSASYIKLTAAAYDDLRHSEVFWAHFSDVRQIDISLEGERYTLTAAEEDGDTLTWYYREEVVELATLQSALEVLAASEFTDEQPTRKEEIGLTVHLDSERFPQVRISLYRYDAGHCLAVVDGESVSLVDRSDVVDLIEAVHAIVLD